MDGQPSPDITRLLSSISNGDSAASAELLDLVYAELHRLASRYMSRERIDHTLQTTGLVHEAYLKLFGTDNPPNLNNREHFFAVAANQMRRILVDHAREHAQPSAKGSISRLTRLITFPSGKNEDRVAIDDALKELAEVGILTARKSWSFVSSGATPTKKPLRFWERIWPKSAGIGSLPDPGCTTAWMLRKNSRKKAQAARVRRPRAA